MKRDSFACASGLDARADWVRVWLMRKISLANRMELQPDSSLLLDGRSPQGATFPRVICRNKFLESRHVDSRHACLRCLNSPLNRGLIFLIK